MSPARLEPRCRQGCRPSRFFAGAAARRPCAHRRHRIVVNRSVGASSPAANYPSQLRALLKRRFERRFEVINLGVGGETAGKTAQRLRRDIPALEPDLVVWQVGTNDALAGAQVAAYEATLRGTLQFLKEQRVDVLLVGMQWTRKLASNEAYAKCARPPPTSPREGWDRFALHAMRQLAEASGSEDLIGPDNLHMNDRGYRCMAEQVAVTLAHSVDADTATTGHL